MTRLPNAKRPDQERPGRLLTEAELDHVAGGRPLFIQSDSDRAPDQIIFLDGDPTTADRTVFPGSRRPL
jgi:hypothetical protein